MFCIGYRRIFLLLILAAILCMQGCGFFNPIDSRLEMLNSEVPKEDAEKLEATKAVLNCFSENDADALNLLLCPKTQRLIDLDEQIQKCFDVFKGKVTSFNEHILGSEEESIENGKKTFVARAWSVDDINTDSNEVYEMYIRTCIINEEDKEREGISEITITTSDGKEFVIGYPWPSYYSDGSKLSQKVISAISENDISRLKSTLCGKTLEISDIDSQIRAGFSFFQGEATMGEHIENGKVYYDGKHDYHTSVKDDEVVINSKPTRTYITVHNYNIETDTGETYKIDFVAYLLYENNKSYEGISQITIKNNNGKKQVIGKIIE